MNDCIFCMIADHQIPAKIIYEDDICMAFLDLSQATDGHTLVIPKKHYKNFLDIDVSTLQHMITIAQQVALKLQAQLHFEGMNLITNMNEVAGQTVNHFHLHIIPRYNKDEGFNPQYEDRSQIVDLDKIYHQIIKE